MVVLLVAVVVRAAAVQGVNRDRYAEAGLDQRVRTIHLPAQRGSIFDRNGSDLALSVPQSTVWADPTQVRDPEAAAAALAPVLDRDVAGLRRALSTPDREFVYLARQVDDATARAVEDLDLPGVSLLDEAKRFYPAGDLAAPVLGIAGIDNVGLGGLELAYEDVLRGRPGEMVVERDPQGREISQGVRSRKPAERGQDLVLTLDQSLQYQAQQVLLQQVDAAEAKGGMAVVADVRTGAILAMASVDGAPDEPDGATGGAAGGTTDGPDGDAARSRPAGHTARNRPVTDVFEPGSTNKVVTISAAIEAGLVGPSTRFTVPDSIEVAGRTFHDAEEHPVAWWTVSDILRESSNVGTIKIGRMLGKERLDSALRSFGFGTRTGVGFPGEAEGILVDPSRYSGTSMATVPVGNGLAVTALQMLDVYVTLARGGVAVPPRLVEATIDAEGRRRPTARGEEHRVVSARTAEAMVGMLTRVVEDGTGRNAAVPGYTVAGKTGTARKAPYDHPPYQYVSSFVGFAPAEAPRLAAIVVLDSPEGLIYGGDVAAPAFSRIMQYALRLEQVPPTRPIEGAAATGVPATEAGGATAPVAGGDGPAASLTGTTPGTG